MPATGTSALSAEVKALYDADFYLQGQGLTYWDQFCDLRVTMNGQRGSSYEFPIIENLQPQTAPLDELNDVTPQQMRANSVSITLQEFGGGVEVTKFVVATSYSDVYKQAAYNNGYNLAESFDYVVRAVAGQGSRQFFVNNRTSRATVDGLGTSADRVSANFIEFLTMLARSSKMPMFEDGMMCTVIHPFLMYDLLQDTGIRNMATYSHPELLFNGELGLWSAMRIVVTSNAKVFWGAGAARTSSLSSTLAAAAAVGDTNLKCTSVTNLSVGQWLNILDATEPANAWSDTNETFRVTTVGTSGAGGTGVDGFALDPGPGDGGGLRFAHASGTTINNSGSVYPVVVLGPNSLMKACSSWTGPYGETVVTGPYDYLGRFLFFGWYAIAGWARVRNGWLLRGECGSSQA